MNKERRATFNEFTMEYVDFDAKFSGIDEIIDFTTKTIYVNNERRITAYSCFASLPEILEVLLRHQLSN